MAAEVKVFEDKARASFQSENEKTAEIKYRPSATMHQRTDSLQLKTLKTETLEMDQYQTASWKDQLMWWLNSEKKLRSVPRPLVNYPVKPCLRIDLFVKMKEDFLQPRLVNLKENILQRSGFHCNISSLRKGNNLTIFTEKTANLAQLKEGTWKQKQAFELVEGKHFATLKPLSPQGLPKDKKFQTQIIRNAIRNLVRKKQSPQRKSKKSKSKSTNPDEVIQKRGTLKGGRDSIRSSKSRKLQKLFHRKNLSVSLETRKVKELQKLQDLVFANTLK